MPFLNSKLNIEPRRSTLSTHSSLPNHLTIQQYPSGAKNLDKEPAKWNNNGNCRSKCLDQQISSSYWALWTQTTQLRKRCCRTIEAAFVISVLFKLDSRRCALICSRQFWIEMDASDREKHLLKCMVRTCNTLSRMEVNCEEITLPYLQKDRDRGYLNLLKHYMLEDPSSSELSFLSNPRWDFMMVKIRRTRKGITVWY